MSDTLADIRNEKDLRELIGDHIGRPWIGGREPTCYGDPDITCLRLTEADLRLILQRLSS
jgi:hypothetical protein